METRRAGAGDASATALTVVEFVWPFAELAASAAKPTCGLLSLLVKILKGQGMDERCYLHCLARSTHVYTEDKKLVPMIHCASLPAVLPSPKNAPMQYPAPICCTAIASSAMVYF